MAKCFVVVALFVPKRSCSATQRDKLSTEWPSPSHTPSQAVRCTQCDKLGPVAYIVVEPAFEPHA